MLIGLPDELFIGVLWDNRKLSGLSNRVLCFHMESMDFKMDSSGLSNSLPDISMKFSLFSGEVFWASMRISVGFQVESNKILE